MSIQFCFGAGKHLALVFLMAFALVGCGGGSSDTTNAADSTPVQAAAATPATETTTATTTTTVEAPPAVDAPDTGSRLHLVFQSLNKGMTRDQVRAYVGVAPTVETGMGLYWEGSDGGMMVYFSVNDGYLNDDIIAVAEWAYRQPTDRGNEMRYF